MLQLAPVALTVFLAVSAMFPAARGCAEECEDSSPVASASLAADDAGEQHSQGGSGCGDCDCGESDRSDEGGDSGCGDCGDGCAACPCCAASFAVAPRLTVRTPTRPSDHALGSLATLIARRHVGEVFQPPRA